ncbi:colicin D domain-containing protein [Abyssalbus ytuae]|uniref:Colicin D C-terminal domain-containing protein n=1 Tax=Abyssalbus ytuae TaxID=2926907 RepID=A0A9E7CTJ5_9FLAO|nr:colicin D domain-containing protein [Abyssalbus ytuae]UOB16287.1 hypothetical protein MQE35_11115 [Abyssalbus ytuae]
MTDQAITLDKKISREVNRRVKGGEELVDVLETYLPSGTIVRGAMEIEEGNYVYGSFLVFFSAIDFASGGGKGSSGKSSSKILFSSFKQLQKKFKHAADFGISGNFNPSNIIKYRLAINQHINSAGTRVIEGTYRGEKVLHYVNPSTGLNVISKKNGEFLSGWKLGAEQLNHVLSHGGLN